MIEIKNLGIHQGKFALSDINFEIADNEYVVLMGRTGSGKTTIIEAICGLRSISKGEILLDGSEISKWPPGNRGIGYVPQDGALFNHLSVEENIGFALKLRKWNKNDIESRVIRLVDLLEIKHLIKRYPIDLSGGEKQRVALARALSFQPSCLCLDEPLSALDEETKETLYSVLENLKHQIDVSVLHITHSNSEAERLADRILLMENGKIKSYS